MDCPHCGHGVTRVVTTATPASESRANRSLIQKAARAIGWWDPTDYRARRRQCLRKSCAKRFDTVEIEVGSLSDAIADTGTPKTFRGLLNRVGLPASEPSKSDKA